MVCALSSERPAYVVISGCAAASLGSIVRVACTENRSVPPAGVGTENTRPERSLARGAFAQLGPGLRQVDAHRGVAVRCDPHLVAGWP